MKVLIVEDETAAAENLQEMLQEIDPTIEVLGNTESVQQTVRWLQQNAKPDLIFLDIHLSDGSSFTIFQQMEVDTPIIFTTAYDQYAIDAFKVNSIDYLLKPIKEQELRQALLKFSKLSQQDTDQYLQLLRQLAGEQEYKSRLLIPYRDKLLPVLVNDIACVYSTNKNTEVYLKDGKHYACTTALDQLMSQLNPHEFIRANKQYIVARSAITNITIWFDSRLLVNVCAEVPERIYVSKNRAAEFKAWIVK
ncbi:MAG: LytTR family DNA-binding domain-containing protein [Bacteroidaceae bacterium]|nr:LytTR family DNA-binding domain-containing protein [Bacteroidaceae bacterium]